MSTRVVLRYVRRLFCLVSQSSSVGDWLQEPPAEAAPPAASDGKKKGLGLSLNMSPDAVTAKALERRASLKQSGEANAMLQIVTSSTSDAAVCSYTRSTHGTAQPT